MEEEEYVYYSNKNNNGMNMAVQSLNMKDIYIQDKKQQHSNNYKQKQQKRTYNIDTTAKPNKLYKQQQQLGLIDWAN